MVGGVLVFLGASALGDTPDTRDTTAQVASYFRTNRTTVFVGCVLFGLMAKGLFELTLVATPLIALALAGLVGGTALGLARASSGRRWFVILSTAIAGAHLVGAVSLAHSGPFSPDVQQQVYLLSLVVWLLTSGRGLRPHDA